MKILCKNSCVFENKRFSYFSYLSFFPLQAHSTSTQGCPPQFYGTTTRKCRGGAVQGWPLGPAASWSAPDYSGCLHTNFVQHKQVGVKSWLVLCNCVALYDKFVTQVMTRVRQKSPQNKASEGSISCNFAYWCERTGSDSACMHARVSRQTILSQN